jgi:diaminopimelate decarboxylase
MIDDDTLREAERAVLAQVAAEYGTPAFVYFADRIEARLQALRTRFGGRFEVSYAMKCNPNPALLRFLRERADSIDVSSSGELRAALDAGWAPSLIGFTGPAKQAADLRLAVDAGIGELVLESLREARQLDGIAGAAGRRQPVLVRIAPRDVPKGFGSSMSGRPTQFGIDEEDLLPALDAIGALRNVEVVGFHAYSGTQCLNGTAIAENWLNFARLFELARAHLGIVPRRLVFGSGLGVRYHQGDAGVDLGAVEALVGPELDRLRQSPAYAGCRMALETGRYLVGEAGIYLTRAVHTKQSRGHTIVAFDGGMNHHLGAAGHLGMVIHRPYRMEVLPAEPARHDPAPQPQDLYGPLCTSIDCLGRGVRLPRVAEGDVLAVQASGAYGPSSSPLGFISHPVPAELLVTTSGGSVRIENCSAAQRR